MRIRTTGIGMRGAVSAAAALLLVLPAAVAGAGHDFAVRVDGKILRKASGKLVLSISGFELAGLTSVRLENRKTGESRSLGVSSVYPDLSYSETLPAEQFEGIREADWIPSVEW